jgi:hypothetical protein
MKVLAVISGLIVILVVAMSVLRGLVIYQEARARWHTRHPGIPYRRRWQHLRTSCGHDDPEGHAWVQRCDRVGGQRKFIHVREGGRT